MWGSGTGIPSAMCEGNRHFNGKSLHHLSMDHSSPLCFTYLFIVTCGHLADICDSGRLPPFSCSLCFHTPVSPPRQTSLRAIPLLCPYPIPSLSSSFPLFLSTCTRLFTRTNAFRTTDGQICRTKPAHPPRVKAVLTFVLIGWVLCPCPGHPC